jgi:hypothetical protein
MTYLHSILITQKLAVSRAVDFPHKSNVMILPLFCQQKPIWCHRFAMLALQNVNKQIKKW